MVNNNIVFTENYSYMRSDPSPHLTRLLTNKLLINQTTKLWDTKTKREVIICTLCVNIFGVSFKEFYFYFYQL